MTRSRSGSPASTLASTLGLLALLVTGAMVAQQPRPAPPPVDPDDAPCDIPGGGYLLGDVYGDLSLRLGFRDAQLHCEGMLRPDEGGVRLMFAGTPGRTGDRAQRIVLVLGLEGQLAGLAGGERFANVTLIDEGSGRFYSAQGRGRCFTTVHRAEPIPAGTGRHWRIEGELYCAGALPSLRDMGSVTLGTLRYAGRLDVDAL